LAFAKRSGAKQHKQSSGSKQPPATTKSANTTLIPKPSVETQKPNSGTSSDARPASKAESSSGRDGSGFDAKQPLVELRNGTLGSSELTLPATLTKKERLLAHEWAEKLGLGHVSEGTGKERRLVATRLGVNEHLTKYKEVRTPPLYAEP
jgi:hypothetical protein